MNEEELRQNYQDLHGRALLKYPTFKLFKECRRALIATLENQNNESFDSFITKKEMHAPDDLVHIDAQLARVAVKLTDGSNFDRVYWEQLIELDREYCALAIEHCYYVFAVSGSDGLKGLGKALESHQTLVSIQLKLAEIEDFNDWSKSWIHRLRTKLNPQK